MSTTLPYKIAGITAIVDTESHVALDACLKAHPTGEIKYNSVFKIRTATGKHNVFKSGKIILTGSTSIQQVETCVNDIMPMYGPFMTPKTDEKKAKRMKKV